jgi:hypothetical protein
MRPNRSDAMPVRTAVSVVLALALAGAVVVSGARPAGATEAAGAAGKDIGSSAPLTGSASGALASQLADDWYVVYPATLGGPVTVKVENTTSPTVACNGVNVWFRNTDGLQLAGVGVEPGLPYAAPVSQALSDRYFVELQTTGCDPTSPVTYTLTLQAGGGGTAPMPASGTTAVGTNIGDPWPPLQGGKSYKGTLASGTSDDWYVLYKQDDGKSATVRVENTTVKDSTPCSSASVYLRDTDGLLLSGLGLSDNTAHTFTVTTAGRYYLELTAAGCAQGGTTYRIEPEAAGQWNKPAPYAKQSLPSGATRDDAGGPLLGGITYAGSISNAQMHLWSEIDVNGKAPVVTISVQNTTVNTRPCSSLAVVLRDSNGYQLSGLGLSDNTGYEFRISVAGRFYLDITDASCDPEGGAPVTVGVTITPAYGVQPSSIGLVRVTEVAFAASDVVQDQRGTGPQVSSLYLDGCTAASSSSQWHDCAPAFPDGVTEKDWPIIAVRGTALTIPYASFVVLPGEDLSGALVMGTATLGAAKFTFSGVAGSQSSGRITVTHLVASAPLPNRVGAFVSGDDGDHSMQITWQITSGTHTFDAGTSHHPVYVVYATPIADPSELYVTLVDLTTRAAAGSMLPQTVVTQTYATFQAAQSGGVIHRRTLDPKSGAVTEDTTSPLTYYPPGWTWAGALANTYDYGCNSLYELLSDLVGRCGSWQQLFSTTMWTEGVPVQELPRLDLLPGFPKPTGLGAGDVLMLVKNWKFGTPTAPNSHRYVTTATRSGATVAFGQKNFWEVAGVPGQNDPNPPGWFDYGDHALVWFNGMIYDPSYGTAPVAAPGKNVCAWAHQSLDGFASVSYNKVTSTYTMVATNQFVC